MRKYKEFTIQSADGTVIWTTSLLVTETELKPERSAGEYWRGTYCNPPTKKHQLKVEISRKLLQGEFL